MPHTEPSTEHAGWVQTQTLNREPLSPAQRSGLLRALQSNYERTRKEGWPEWGDPRIEVREERYDAWEYEWEDGLMVYAAVWRLKTFD